MKPIEYYLALDYRMSIHRDEEGDYVVEVNDLQGCASHGSTPNEALDNVAVAKRLWIESRFEAGLDIPEPRHSDEYSGRILLRMPKSLHRRLAEQSREERVSLNQYTVSLLSDASARYELRSYEVGNVSTCPTYAPLGPPYQGLDPDEDFSRRWRNNIEYSLARQERASANLRTREQDSLTEGGEGPLNNSYVV